MSELSFSLEQARKRVEERVASNELLGEVDIIHVPDLDTAGLYAFSVTPRAIGRAGEVIFLVGPDEMLTAGTASDFDSLMARLGVGTTPNVLDLPAFARRFLRLRVLRNGVLLERPDAHPLIKPGQLPARRFLPPTYDFGADGARYRFWVFDTDRFVPVFWDVRVAPSGATTFATEEALP
jgi:hypothetical protein